VRRILFLVQLPAALMVLYLDALSLAALLRRRGPLAVPDHSRFAVLVPAHDEEALLPRLLDSIFAVDYPRDLCDVHVIADNCGDRTADIAVAAGAIVHERRDDQLKGKGYALRWALARIRESGSSYDAFVILDADSVVSHNFLQVMNRHLARGDQAVQSYYGVLNPKGSWSSALRYAGLALYNGLRPRGREALGLSVGLHGNGMCFSADVLERLGWEAFTLAEDVEFHFELVEAGIRVRYAAEANVLATMPTSLRQAQSQNVRWERGRLQMLATLAPHLLALGARRRDPLLLDAVAEQLVPPLSVLTGVTGMTFLITVALRSPGPRRLATLTLLGQIGYVLTGLRLVGAPRAIYLALLRAPLYILWKLAIYVMAAARIGESRWVRTARSSD
jgi:cellulose synthase/poly-beta-1,6-N-acetylglucosamine synthase-like glycosyltransferase